MQIEIKIKFSIKFQFIILYSDNTKEIYGFKLKFLNFD